VKCIQRPRHHACPDGRGRQGRGGLLPHVQGHGARQASGGRWQAGFRGLDPQIPNVGTR